MTHQIDMLADLPRSLPPHLDPDKVGGVQVHSERDCDHVGENDVGKFGNDALVHVVEVLDKAGEVIWAETRPTSRMAATLADEIMKKLSANRQGVLFG